MGRGGRLFGSLTRCVCVFSEILLGVCAQSILCGSATSVIRYHGLRRCLPGISEPTYLGKYLEVGS